MRHFCTKRKFSHRRPRNRSKALPRTGARARAGIRRPICGQPRSSAERRRPSPGLFRAGRAQFRPYDTGM
ncbi:hypothetical protein CEJ86_00065 [Sinorhizobium meliloti]|uniref:Uncharacterized protein n=1 Tax=Rhizobium meliloti TaxID=382 RepID=A0A2J0Z817_RHIML|nr:hypothetical protein CEJ86_00065 [Sinorhizobium meliloti]